MKKHLILLCLIPIIFIQLPLYGEIPTPWESRDAPKETTENKEQETEPYQCSTENLSAIKILVNASQTDENSSNGCDEEDDSSSHNWWASPRGLYVMGYIEYLDNIEIFRRTVFCQRYGISTNKEGIVTRKFSPVRDPDYEYAD